MLDLPLDGFKISCDTYWDIKVLIYKFIVISCLTQDSEEFPLRNFPPLAHNLPLSYASYIRKCQA